MLLSDVLYDRFVFLKYESGKLKFWNEDACGYVEDIHNAGIYDSSEISEFGLRCFREDEIKKKLYWKNIHFAVSLENAIKYFNVVSNI